MACIPLHPLPATVTLPSFGKLSCLSDGHCLPFPHSDRVHASLWRLCLTTEPAFLPCCCCFCCSPLPLIIFLKYFFLKCLLCNFFIKLCFSFLFLIFYKLARKSLIKYCCIISFYKVIASLMCCLCLFTISTESKYMVVGAGSF